MSVLNTAGLLIIQHRKLLLAYSSRKQCYYLPGGKLDADETPAEALCREAAEELALQLTVHDLQFYTHISAPAFGEAAGTLMEQDCFIVLKEVHPTASAEIAAINWFSLHDYLQQKHQAPGAIMILQQLKSAGLID